MSGNFVDRLSSSLSSFTQRISGAREANVVITAATAATASLIAAWALTRPSYDTLALPKIKRAPEHAKDGPCKYDIYPDGKQIETPLGRINYYIVGNANATKKVLLVHGISTPSPAWQLLVPKLTAAGYQVLMYDLYGRGYSDAPEVSYDIPLFVSQISYLLTALGPEWARFDLVGMSLGGPIATSFAHYFPNRVNRIYLLCPAGATPKRNLSTITRFALSHYNFLGMKPVLKYGALDPRKSNEIAKWQVENHPGFLDAFCGSMKEGPIYNVGPLLQATVKAYGPRIRAVWGDVDSIVPMSSREYWGELEVDVIPGGEHWIVLSHPDVVAKYILAHFGA